MRPLKAVFHRQIVFVVPDFYASRFGTSTEIGDLRCVILVQNLLAICVRHFSQAVCCSDVRHNLSGKILRAEYQFRFDWHFQDISSEADLPGLGEQSLQAR
ncbi:hypothetical protein D9M68_688150 [compost metagenome]